MTADAMPSAVRRDRTFPRVAAITGGIFFLVPGVWAMVAPNAFFEALAAFEPYNQHFIQDIGAFQIGLGAVLLLAAVAPVDGLGAALLGVGIGGAAHTISHVIGRDLGGRPQSDIPLFALLTVVLLAAGAMQWRGRRD